MGIKTYLHPAPAEVPHVEMTFSAEVTAAGWICALYRENIITWSLLPSGVSTRDGRKGECGTEHLGVRGQVLQTDTAVN